MAIRVSEVMAKLYEAQEPVRAEDLTDCQDQDCIGFVEGLLEGSIELGLVEKEGERYRMTDTGKKVYIARVGIAGK